MPASALAIDFDGVIADTQEYHARAWEIVLGDKSLPDLRTRIAGASPRQFLTTLGLDVPRQQQLMEQKEKQLLLLARTEPPRLFDSVAVTLHWLSPRYALAVVSAGERSLIDMVFERHNLASLFRVIIAGSDVEHSKPDPGPYYACLAALQLPPNRVVAVEDTPAGIASAHAAGLLTIAVSHSQPAAGLEGADIVIEHFGHLPSALTKLASP